MCSSLINYKYYNANNPASYRITFHKTLYKSNRIVASIICSKKRVNKPREKVHTLLGRIVLDNVFSFSFNKSLTYHVSPPLGFSNCYLIFPGICLTVFETFIFLRGILNFATNWCSYI